MDTGKGTFREERFCYRGSVFCRVGVLLLLVRRYFRRLAGGKRKEEGEEDFFGGAWDVVFF